MVFDPRAKGKDGENLSKRINKIQKFYLLLLFLWDHGILCDKTHSGHNKWESVKGIR